MQPLIQFAFFLINAVLSLLVFIVVAWAIVSMLIAFNVINVRNPIANSIWRALDAVARPLMRPIQRFLPSFGGLDFSPWVFIVVVGGVQNFLLPPLELWLLSLTGPGIAY